MGSQNVRNNNVGQRSSAKSRNVGKRGDVSDAKIARTIINKL